MKGLLATGKIIRTSKHTYVDSIRLLMDQVRPLSIAIMTCVRKRPAIIISYKVQF